METVKKIIKPVAIFLIIFGIILIVGSIIGFTNEDLSGSTLSEFRSLYNLAKSWGMGSELDFQDYLTYNSVVLLVFGLVDIALGACCIFVSKKL